MGAIIKIISRFAAMLRKPFQKKKAALTVNGHEEMRKAVSRAENAIYKNIKIQLQNNPHIEKYGAEVRLLHRRLAQYERMRTHASLIDQSKALGKLEKQWRKVESISNRKDHKDNSCVQGAVETGHPRRSAELL